MTYDLERGILKIERTVYQAKDSDGNWNFLVDTPKTKSSDRVIPLPDYITEMLKKDRNLARSPYVVENKKGERMAIRLYQYQFARLTEKAGIRTLNFHALRHTFATRAIECGMDIRTIADIMGHNNVSVTLNRYANCMLDHKIEMMHKLTRIL